MTSSPVNSPSPSSEDDRDRAVRRLREPYAEGHIAHEELDVRLDQVLTARADSERLSALSSLPAAKADPAATITAAGRIKRVGSWRVPRFLKVASAYGGVRLDLSRAVIEHPVVDIELRLGTGRARITVPRDAIVDYEDLRTGWKDTRHGPRRDSRPGGPTIRISGTMEYGRPRIRHARR
ncbi:DUF1707 SHOCT-like domain-containing protein [Streptomyces sp. NBC_01451]|uniref:DUF1707 SHOCT-like domain-containing protein n=1 Tax=Streptomyces sp. NBC_01451 TaxID=2903872 RepID=UPI002E33BD08|nr:DUF1707 domain-containing protein [Streptomyces sp. NBC_01451]